VAVLKDNALTTLEDLKSMIGISEDDLSNDNKLIQLINRASARVESALDRKLKLTNYFKVCNGSGGHYLLVENYPITDIDYIKIDDEIIEPETYDINDGGKIGMIYKADGWVRRGYTHGLAGDTVGDIRYIDISYNAGYILPNDATEEQPATLPSDLEGLVQDMIAEVFGKMQTGGSGGLKSFSIADVRWEWKDGTREDWQAIIDAHKRKL
jgi:hypothetical protein